MFRAKCPCCGASLLVDEKKRRVVNHTSQEDVNKSAEERFSDNLEKVRKAKAEQTKKFEDARGKERERKDRLASLFDDAAKKVKEDGPDVEPPQRFWD